MLPRNNRIKTGMISCLIFFLLIFLYGLAFGGDKNGIIQFYQDYISAADGDRCPMVPSCSAYAAQAIEKHGPVLGWMMACDRLVRCGRDEVTRSKKRWVSGQTLTVDPVQANDFWWFKKETKE